MLVEAVTVPVVSSLLFRFSVDAILVGPLRWFIRAVVGDESIGPVNGLVTALFIGLGLAGFFHLRLLTLAALFGFLPLALHALESVVGFTCHLAIRLSGVGCSDHGP